MKHVVVFVPAYNEEENIVEMMQSIPKQIPGVRVTVIVIDDGSSDRTVELAREAGADHTYSLGENRGLGAAVREGLRRSCELSCDVSVMIDADLEYPARQIPELIEPILNDEVDYVMGSRFLGTITGMKLHRRLGNYLFTFIQSLLLKRWIYDGQSGMRAFSREAAEKATIIHDYNYAQVLTLNLIRKNFRMKEIPIQYKVREKGQSFIKFKAYLSSVIPAIVREMRSNPSPKRGEAVESRRTS
ncbi:glycosyl transferase family 2 [Pontibacillus halophilus JSM 076056 = DSM 19796]|uniref:Glycosyl transferase family 2 n=1 Tax=Pontibacillus halophilus JSM 076056 = DSM 19796 TaxID=1385510 RepID=A0A0A5GN79_9BACI|nr:glycosyltransferase family 2 protein [Pontibacillus halophilus]KGX93434.1 glycosyl transferase family 2 [Pontibacillus halophilus JSM 076056 = DSM 19796]